MTEDFEQRKKSHCHELARYWLTQRFLTLNLKIEKHLGEK